MTNKEFITALEKYKNFLKPAIFSVLVENAEAFSETTKIEIVEKLKEADAQMYELYEYQQKRNGIMQKGIERMNEIYVTAKAKFQAMGKADQEAEIDEADQLISNL